VGLGSGRRVERDEHAELVETPAIPRQVRERRAGMLSGWDTHAEPKRRYEPISRIIKTAAIICRTQRMSTPILSWMHPQHVSSRGIGFSSPDDMAERATNSPGRLAPRGVDPPTTALRPLARHEPRKKSQTRPPHVNSFVLRLGFNCENKFSQQILV